MVVAEISTTVFSFHMMRLNIEHTTTTITPNGYDLCPTIQQTHMALSKAKLAEGIKNKVGTLHLHPCLWAWVGHDPLGEGIHNVHQTDLLPNSDDPICGQRGDFLGILIHWVLHAILSQAITMPRHGDLSAFLTAAAVVSDVNIQSAPVKVGASVAPSGKMPERRFTTTPELRPSGSSVITDTPRWFWCCWCWSGPPSSPASSAAAARAESGSFTCPLPASSCPTSSPPAVTSLKAVANASLGWSAGAN
ncbi:hypothetical protein E2C01_040938 [Portunus trituberculatus]|uniref:Uncharacterized protein n=1 Tax=Portunus trituberculatus TaxID=210409 RepID=A0A5B7FIQ7_PORTR|nr:hypothetical protein [Portunus trituberculatus]